MESDKSEKIHGMKVDDDGEEEEEEEEEEEKIEKFFSLIRNFRDARDRIRNELKEQRKNKQQKQNKWKAEHDHEDPQSGWVPKFRLEDFTQEIEFKSLPLKFPNPCNSNHEADKGSGLDLKLTL